MEHQIPKRADTTRRWGVKPESRVWVGGHNVAARRATEIHLAGTARPPTGPIDLAFIAPESIDEAVYFAQKISPRLVQDAVIWVVWPKAAIPKEERTDDVTDLNRSMAEHSLAAGETVHVGDAFLSISYQAAAV